MSSTSEPLQAPADVNWLRDAKVISIVAVAHFVSHVYIMLLPPIFLLVKDHFGVGYTEIALALTAYNVMSALLQTRRRLLGGVAMPSGAPSRRLYVSRRDAKPHRRWAENEPEVEALFASRGFEIVSMGECPLPEQVRLFSSARVVARVVMPLVMWVVMDTRAAAV